MAVVKGTDIIDGSVNQELEKLAKNLQVIVTSLNSVSKSSKTLNEQTKKTQQTFSQTGESVKKVAQNSQQLSTLEKERIKIQNQLNTTLSKSLATREKNTKALAKGKAQLQQRNKFLKQEAELQRLSTKEGKKLNDQIKKQSSQLSKAKGTWKNLGGELKNTLLRFVGITVAIGSLVKLFKNSIKTISSFEKGMDEVAAITGATSKEFNALRKDALRLGSSTSKTATNVSKLQKEFAKLGFSTKEIIKATEATIQLSIAAGSDLANSATVAASTIRGFALDANETQRVVDVMAASFSSSALDLEKFKSAMANAQVAAKTTGHTLEETSAFLSVIADTGTDASKAGTDLRVIFSKLAIKGIDLNKALDDVENSSNKVATAQKLVGDRAFSSLITLAENRKKTDQLTKSYENSAGAAKEMARVMEDNLQGKVKRLSSAWEGLVLTFGKSDGLLSKIVVGFTKMLNAITDIRKVKISDEIKKEQLQLNILVGRLTDSNTKEDDRRKLIEEIRKINPDVVEGINAENVAIDKLTKNLAKANLQYLNKIALQIEDEAVQEKREKAGKRLNRSLKYEDKLRKEINIAALKYKVTTEIQTKSFQEQIDVLKQTDAALASYNSSGQRSASTTENLEQSLRELNARNKEFKKTEEESIIALEKRNELAKRLGVLTDEEIAALDAKTEAVTESQSVITNTEAEAEKTKEELRKAAIAKIEVENQTLLNGQKQLLLDRFISEEEFAIESIKLEISRQRQILELESQSAIDKLTIESALLDDKKSLQDAEIASATKIREDEKAAKLDDLAFYEEFLQESNEIEIEQQKELDEEMAELNKGVTERHLAEADARIAKTEEEKAAKIDALMLVWDIGNALFDLASAQRDAELSDVEKKRKAELKLAKGNKDAEEKINDKFDKEAKKIKTEQAKADKNAALINAGINTAIGVTKALGQGGVAGIILGVLVAAAGAIQIAAIASQPTPTFEKGVTNFEGGMAIVGDEQGSASGHSRELVNIPGVGMTLSPDTPTLMNLPRGSDVIPNFDTELILNGGVSAEKLDEMIDSNNRIEQAIMNRPEHITSLSDDGLKRSYNDSKSYIEYIETYLAG